jgi:hypothetical protein
MPLDRPKYTYSDPLSVTSISIDSGVTVGDTISSANISNGKILFSATGTTYIPVGLSTVVANSVAYQATQPINPSIGQLWVDSSSNNTSFDPNIIRRKTFTATGGQTAFIADYSFTDGYEQVYLNGLLLVKNTDYTTVNSIQINLNVAAVVNDIVEIVAVTNLNAVGAAGALTTSNTFTGTQTFTPSSAAITPITVNGAFNQTADLLDIKNYSGTSLIAVSSSGNFGINQQYPSVPLDVIGNSTIARFIGINSTYQGFAVQNNYASSTAYGAAFFDARNESGAAVANFIADINTDGSSAWSWATQPLGTRTDRRVERMRITSDGRITFNTTAYGNLNPGNYAFDFTNAGAWLKGAITTTGSYGGPISMLDGTNGWNIRLQDSGANIRFASGSTTTGLTDRFKFRNDGVFETYNTIYVPKGTASGNVTIQADATGMSSSSYNYVINGSNDTSNALVVFINGSARTADNGVNSVTIRNDLANLYLGRSGATTYVYGYTAASDRTLKENIVDYSGGIDIIKSLKPQQFNFIDNPRTQYGFIAQEVTNDKIVIEGKNGEPWGVDYNGVVSALTLAVQELTTRLEKLEGK